MAQDPGAHLDRLPDELLLQIIDMTHFSEDGKFPWKDLSTRDLISLALTSRRYYRIAISAAYKRHVKEQKGLAIYWAIKNEEHGTLERLVENGVDVNMHFKHPEGLFGDPITVEGYFDMVGLENTKAFINPPWRSRFSPLAWAASHGHDSMVEYLLDHGADTEQLSEKLCTCHDHKLIRCPHNIPDPLELYSRDPDDDKDDSENDGFFHDPYYRDEEASSWKPLHYALCNEHESTAQLLIERGADANKVGYFSGLTALHIATRWELDKTIDYLLDNDCVDIDAQVDVAGDATALHMAQVAGRDDLVDKYLDHGADINLEFSGRSGPWTIFVMACVAGDYGRALEFLKRGAHPHFVLKTEGLDDPWTAMRLIYWSTGDAYEFPMTQAEERMELEREIIARGNGSPAAT